MSTIEIAKEAFPWEAAATAFTGVLAVCGAVWVGLKQAGISKRQVQILAQQTKIQQVSVQRELFDKRFAVHEATLALVQEAIRKRNFPDETDREFLKQREVARFLFTPKVVENLNALRGKLIELEFQKSTAEDPAHKAEALRKASSIVKELRLLNADGIAKIFLEETSIDRLTAP